MGNHIQRFGICCYELCKQDHIISDPAAPLRERLPTIGIPDSDAILCRLRIPQEKYEEKIKQNEKEISSLVKKAKEFHAAGNIIQAKAELKKKKILKEHTENLRGKLNLIEKQQDQIKKADEDESFTNVLSDSNKILERQLEKVNFDAIQYANELAEESKHMQNQINELTADDQEFDDEIELELNQLLAQNLVTPIEEDIFMTNRNLNGLKKAALILN